jgi:hypothetical protein
VKNILKILFAAWAAGPVAAWAQQPGSLGDEQINVVKPYRPILSDAVKISEAPPKDTVSVLPPVLKYGVEEKRLETQYNITPIKPVRVKDENIRELYRGFVKAGYGNYNTPYGEAYFNALRSKDFDAGVRLRHLSSQGKIKGYGHPGFSENDVSVFGKKYLDRTALSGRLAYDRDAVHYYGFTLDNFSKKETLHRMSAVEGAFEAASTHNDKHAVDFGAGVTFSSFSDNLGQSESDFVLGGFAGIHLANNHYFRAGLELNPMKTQWPGRYCPPGALCPDGPEPDDITLSRTLFRLRPRYEFTKDKIRFSAGGNIAVESAYDETKWHLYPVVEARYPLIRDAVMVTGELSGDLQKNSLRTLNAENPFLIPVPVQNAVMLANTSNKINARGGLEVRADRGLVLAASAGVSRFRDDVFFVNSLNTTGITTYSTVYFHTTQLNVHGEVRYEYLRKLGLWLKTDYYSYDVPDGQKPWYRPSVALTVGGHYRIREKIYISSEVYYTGSRPYQTVDGEGAELKSFVDANLGVDYRYSKVLSVFVKLNNFTGSRYFHWYRYPSYRLNAMAGLSYSF